MDLFQDQNDLPELDDNKNYLEELVGENKKFSDAQALARGKYEADLFVERLKQENQGLRNELTQRVKMEEFLDKLNSATQQKSPEAGQQPSDQTKAEAGLKTEDVLKLLEQNRQKEKAEENVSKVMDRLQKDLGPNYATKLKQVTNNLGLSPNHLNNLAATSPEAFYKLVGLEEEKRQDLFQSPPRNQMTPTFKPQNTVKDWDYYEKLRKEDKVKYWSPAVQNQMHADAMKLGSDFKKS